jgi:peptide-methionine (R)-S-oxide reductase
MTRKSFLRSLLALPAVATLPACMRGQSQPTTMPDDIRVHPAIDGFEPLDKPDSAWRDVVSDDAFRILFEEGTEPRYSSPLLKEKRRGTYICAACHLPLFTSVTKYESGTGWPSFWAPIEDRLGTKRDTKLAMPRTEYHCARCGGHQGHVFEDGPDPTGLRYCNNGLALAFVTESDPLPPLRS